MKFTPKLDEHIRNQETLESCPSCSGVAVAGEVCLVCMGVGMVSVSKADRWRMKNGIKPKRGPLPPPRMPPTK
jgi:hypothetical protein